MRKLIHFVLIVFTFSIIKAQQPPPPVLYPNESYTKLYSVSYDFQSNGSVRYIAEDPLNSANKFVIIMAQHDTVPGINKNVYCSIFDFGNVWYPDYINNNYSWGFPDLSLSNGIPIISLSKSGSSSAVSKDVFFGALGFSWVSTFPAGIIWTHLAAVENENIVVAGIDSLTLTGKYSTYNYISNTWSPLIPLPLISGTTGSICVASGVNGRIGIFGLNNNNKFLFLYKSINYGVTFDSGTLVFNYLVDGEDTLYANSIGGFQALYLNIEPHIVFTVYKKSSDIFPNPHTTKYIKPKILHWSPSSGIKILADKFKIHNLADTITTSNMAPLGQPSIGIWKDYVLFCSFTAFLKGNTQIVDDGTVVNAGEIFVSRSFNASRWNTPVNITGTPDIEEKNSSLPVKTYSSQMPSIFFIRDMKAGNWVDVPSWGKAPVYGIFKNNLNSTVGINQINTHIRQYDLSQNYPNPFNASTKIKFSIPEVAFTSIIIYNIRGSKVAELVNQKLNPGSYEYDFNSIEFDLPSGMYFYKLISGDFSQFRKMILLK